MKYGRPFVNFYITNYRHDWFARDEDPRQPLNWRSSGNNNPVRIGFLSRLDIQRLRSVRDYIITFWQHWFVRRNQCISSLWAKQKWLLTLSPTPLPRLVQTVIYSTNTQRFWSFEPLFSKFLWKSELAQSKIKWRVCMKSNTITYFHESTLWKSPQKTGQSTLA